MVKYESYQYRNGELYSADIRECEIFEDLSLLIYEYYSYSNNTWVSFTYVYDFENCIRNRIYENSDGQVSEDQEEYHALMKSVGATCTQWGYEICEHCGLINYFNEPHGHWFAYDSESDYCQNCGLKSNNYEMGEVFLELLENTTDYIKIGFCNKYYDFEPTIVLYLYINEELIELSIGYEMITVYENSGYIVINLSDISSLYDEEFILNNPIDLVVVGIASELEYSSKLRIEDIFLDSILSQHENVTYEYELSNPESTCEDGILVKLVCNDCGMVLREYITTDEEIGGNYQKYDGHYLMLYNYTLDDYGIKGKLTVVKCICEGWKEINLEFSYSESMTTTATTETINDRIYIVSVQKYYKDNEELPFSTKYYTYNYEEDGISYEEIITYYGYIDNDNYLYKDVTISK